MLALLKAHPASLTLPEDVKPTFAPEAQPLLRLMPIPAEKDVRKATKEQEDHIREMLKEVSPGIYVFDFLPAEFCNKILEEIAHFEEWCETAGERVHRPNSMNAYGAIFDDFGFESVLEQFVAQVMNVLSAVAFPHIGATLDHHHGFEVAYQIGKDEDLDLHVDDAEVTLNICLGKTFTAGELAFAGVRCNHHQSSTHPLPHEMVQVQHKLGQACLHLGRQRHAAMPISSGDRFNFILWCRSSKFRRLDRILDCPDWCPISSLIDQQAENDQEE